MKKRIILGLIISIMILLILVFGYGAYKNAVKHDVISLAIAEALGETLYYQGKSDSPNVELCYRYAIQETKDDLLNNMVGIVNDVIEKEEITKKVDILLYYEVPGGWARLVRFCNYSDNEQSTPDCEGLQRVVITGNAEEDSEYIFNNPVSYSALPNIKYLEISNEIQEIAEEKDIDWYEYWPELESIKVFE